MNKALLKKRDSVIRIIRNKKFKLLKFIILFIKGKWVKNELWILRKNCKLTK